MEGTLAPTISVDIPSTNIPLYSFPLATELNVQILSGLIISEDHIVFGTPLDVLIKYLDGHHLSGMWKLYPRHPDVIAHANVSDHWDLRVLTRSMQR